MQLKREYFIISGLSLAVGAVVGFFVGDRYNNEYYNLLMEEEAEIISVAANEKVRLQVEHFDKLYKEAAKAHQLYLGIEPDDLTEQKAEEILEVVLSRNDEAHVKEEVIPNNEDDPKIGGKYQQNAEGTKYGVKPPVVTEVSDEPDMGPFYLQNLDGRKFDVKSQRTIQPEGNHVDLSIVDEERRKNFDQIVASGNPYHPDVRRNIPGNNEPMPNPDVIMFDDPDNLFEVSHMLTREEGLESETGYTSGTLTYYSGNDVLLDERDQPVEDVIKKMVGLKNLEELATGPEPIIYVRNDKLQREFEIILVEENYTEPENGFTNTARDRGARPRGDGM